MRDGLFRLRVVLTHAVEPRRALAEVEFIPDDTRAALVVQPHDAATGRRLGVLAVLLDAHAELAARLRSGDAAHVHIDDAERRNAAVIKS